MAAWASPWDPNLTNAQPASTENKKCGISISVGITWYTTTINNIDWLYHTHCCSNLSSLTDLDARLLLAPSFNNYTLSIMVPIWFWPLETSMVTAFSKTLQEPYLERPMYKMKVSLDWPTPVNSRRITMWSLRESETPRYRMQKFQSTTKSVCRTLALWSAEILSEEYYPPVLSLHASNPHQSTPRGICCSILCPDSSLACRLMGGVL